MFSLVTGLYQSYFTPKSISLLIIGCDGVGKTALLERCKISKFTKRRFPPSAVVATCRAGKAGRLRGAKEALKHEEHLHQSSQRNVSSLPETLNMDKIRPTVGQNFAKVDLFGAKSVLWDLGGRKQMRPLWERYYNDCDGIIFVVEATMFYNTVVPESPTEGSEEGKKSHSSQLSSSVTSNNRLLEAKEELKILLHEEALHDVPILIFVNKVDEVLCQHQQYQRHREEELDEFWEDELYECVMQRLELSGMTMQNAFAGKGKNSDADKKKKNRVEERHEGEELTNATENLARPGRIEVFVGSAKTGQGVRIAMEWMAQTACTPPSVHPI